MKCTNKNKVTVSKATAAFLIICIMIQLNMTGCGKASFAMPYHENTGLSGFNVIENGESVAALNPFASDLCVIPQDIAFDDSVDMTEAGAAILFGLEEKEILFSKNPHEKLYPASLTKVMTALVALENGNLEQILTATNEVNITEAGAQLCGLKAGDTMTLSQALHILLIYSANDVAMLIAENIGQTVDGFITLMNEKAQEIGATNTHFVNPHGLTDVEHYTTAYDLYLIFNEALKYNTFYEIIHMTSYQTTYQDKNGADKELSFQTTNRFLRGHFQPPSNITVIGGKSGTTNAAGHCLMLLSKDTSGSPYISIILRSKTNDILYTQMIDLLEEINK